MYDNCKTASIQVGTKKKNWFDRQEEQGERQKQKQCKRGGGGGKE